MQNIIKSLLVWGIILPCIIGSWSCKGGKIPELGDITGPATVDEYGYVEYSISFVNATGVTYLWSCDPAEAGKFDNPDLPKTGFTASMVTQDTPVKISVVVESQQFSPVILSRNITIRDKGPYGWTRTWGAFHSDRGEGVAIDGNDNAYVTGYFCETVDFNPGPGVDLHGSIGSADIFLSKFDSNGEFQWARTWGGWYGDYDCGYGVAVDGSGNAYVTGRFYKTVDFDPGPGVNEHTSIGSYDIFLSKFDPNGEFQWTRTWGGGSKDIGYGVAVDGNGNAYVTGYYAGTADFDPGPGVDEHTSISGNDIFLSKFDSNGEFQWARTWGGYSRDSGYGIAIDGNGNAYITGRFIYTVDFDPGPGVDEHTSIGSYDIFLSKFDSSGQFHWARAWGSENFDYGQEVATNSSGKVYITGHFFDKVDFDPGPGSGRAYIQWR